MLIDDTRWFKGITGDGFEASLEYNELVMFVHLDKVEKMNIKTFREIKKFLTQAYEMFSLLGYKAIFTHVPTDREDILRLDEMLGFKPFVKPDFDSIILIYEGE